MTDEFAVRKMSVSIPMSDEVAIDLGLMEAPPLTEAELRARRSRQWREWIALNIPRPLLWVKSGSGWLYVEAANLLYRALRLNVRMAHDGPADEEDW